MIEYLFSIFNFIVSFWEDLSENTKTEIKDKIKKKALEYLEGLFRAFYKKHTGSN